ncbi:hypothetical protein OBBRIDRAFT_791355 [Obba rivulosa]|uniref:Uncharacterized protein n=1 Tax=Obba rivulosa TaxID=1052685 RepID=A0A8E2B4K7_9APHY|nr:hypothetical protein OBBRIDRAFT_791355 [Obba rivulosa]
MQLAPNISRSRFWGSWYTKDAAWFRYMAMPLRGKFSMTPRSLELGWRSPDEGDASHAAMFLTFVRKAVEVLRPFLSPCAVTEEVYAEHKASFDRNLSRGMGTPQTVLVLSVRILLRMWKAPLRKRLWSAICTYEEDGQRRICTVQLADVRSSG